LKTGFNKCNSSIDTTESKSSEKGFVYLAVGLASDFGDHAVSFADTYARYVRIVEQTLLGLGDRLGEFGKRAVTWWNGTGAFHLERKHGEARPQEIPELDPPQGVSRGEGRLRLSSRTLPT
jgi:hypothetical protein